MIERIIEFCAHNRFIVLLITAAAVLLGARAMQNITLDAIPDLSDTQVIIYSRWDRSPDIIEDQVTYPIVSAMLGVPKVKDIRGFSDFGYSYVYIIFEEGTDIYWARSRTLEYLNNIMPKLPEGVNVELARDATAIGWVYQYALVDTSGRRNLAGLRSLQDWHLRYELQAIPGVSEVAPIGGFVRQYQVTVDPNALAAYRVPIEKVVEAVKGGNNDVGGRLLEFTGREYMVRGRGYIRSVADIENTVIAVSGTGTPVLVKNVGRVVLGPDIRRGIAELDGQGEVAGAIVIMRSGEDALRVIERVKARLAEIEPSLPEGVKVVTTYDRSELINRSIETLNDALTEEIIVVSLIILIFLWHIPSAIVPIITITFATIIAFIPMYGIDVTANIMSLAGIAIAIGAMVDAAIVVIEQVHKKLEAWEAEGRKADYRQIIVGAAKEVGAPSFYSLLVIAVSFIPVFALEGQEGRLFKPLAFTKNLSMATAAALSITLVPAIIMLFIRPKRYSFRPRWLCRIVNAIAVGKIHREEKHPVSRLLMRVYEPVVRSVLRHPWKTIGAALLIVAATIPVFFKLGSEFMPPLDEGVILYMPTTMPGISVTEAGRLLQTQDRIIKSFPEVERVFGKAGRAETATDPAPFSMMETTVILRPHSEWPKVPRWYSSWAPDWLASLLRRAWPDHKSTQELIYGPGGLNEAMQIPGVVNAWTMPIKARIDMLTTGVRTPVGIKVLGPDLEKIQEIGQHIEHALRDLPGTTSVFAERTAGGYFLDFDLDREELARYGLSIEQAQSVILSAIGGDNVTTTVEGRERYPVNIRYMRDYRSTIDRLERALVPVAGGAQVPIAQIAEIKLVSGPGMIRDENGRLSGYVYVDTSQSDLGGYVSQAKQVVRDRVKLPPGYTLVWSGQYENMQRAAERLTVVVPITLLIIFMLIYFNTRSTARTLIVLLAVPFSAVGAIWFLYFLGYNTSIAVWVGLIALLGVDAETGVFMLLYLDMAYRDRSEKGLMRTKADLGEAIIEGAVKRLRPKFMTVAVDFIGLVPIMWATGTGSDVMKRIAAPLVAGVFTSFIMELVVYPAIYAVWKWHSEVKKQPAPEAEPVAATAWGRTMPVKNPIAIFALIAAAALFGGEAAVAQSRSADETDPVSRSMRMIQALVEERAEAAEAVVAASKLIDRSAAAQKQGDRDKARAALEQAEELAADWKAFDRSGLIDELNRLIAAEQAALDRAGNRQAQPSTRAAMSISLPQSVSARMNAYRDSFARILRQEGVPVGLLAVALVESGFNPLALSPKGARGIWQFMPATASRYGLAVSAEDDHRTAPELSTRAAARYLRDLYRQFGDWKLAIAAYNSGEGRVQRIIDRTGIRSFEEMARRRLLPAETRSYVPAVLAAWAQLEAGSKVRDDGR